MNLHGFIYFVLNQPGRLRKGGRLLEKNIFLEEYPYEENHRSGSCRYDDGKRLRDDLGADSTIRPMATLLQNELGVPVEVRNETGGSGVTGATYAYKQPADGYTFLLGTQSLYIQDMLDNMDFNFKDEFECEDILVHSINMLAGSKKQMDKYGIKTFSDLKEYAAAHPYEVSVAMLTATGVDGMCFEIATEGLALNVCHADCHRR